MYFCIGKKKWGQWNRALQALAMLSQQESYFDFWYVFLGSSGGSHGGKGAIKKSYEQASLHFKL